MAVLENNGLIAQTHISSGRVPTEKGYRFYVNLLQISSTEKPKSTKKTEAIKSRISAQPEAEFAIRSAVDSLVEMTGNLGLATVGKQLYLNGISNLFAQPEFLDAVAVQQVARLIDDLEPWLREARPNEPINIFIGNENPIGKGAGASLIISKFRSPLSDNSYIGVLGPTRQNYRATIHLVQQIGQTLENYFFATYPAINLLLT
jgi:heat-inducible transcriptional repressor